MLQGGGERGKAQAYCPTAKGGGKGEVGLRNWVTFVLGKELQKPMPLSCCCAISTAQL